jgi:DNA-binding transcriptional LysR family regulator
MDDATATNPKAPFRRAFAALARNAPGVELHLTVAPPGEMEAGLAEERFHLAIGPFQELSAQLAMFPIYMEKQILCCGRAHPLFGIPDGEVKTEQIESALYAARSHMDGSTLIDGVAFRNTARAPYMETIALLILSGEYIGYLPRHFAQTWIEHDEMWPLAVGNLSYDSQFSVAARKSLVYPAATYLLRQLCQQPKAA